MEEDLDFSTDFVSDDSLDDFSVDDSVELLDFEDEDIVNSDALSDHDTESLDINDFSNEIADTDIQNDESEIEELDFDNSDIMSDNESENITDTGNDLSEYDFNEALVDNNVRDVPFVDTNYEDAGEIGFSDLENPDSIDEELSSDDILFTNDFNEPISDNTYVDNVIDSEDDGSAKVLTRNPDELISVGNDLINDRLEVLEDQYRDDGLSEEEIQSRLADDKLEIQQEFLNDAFPDQGVSPDVFNRFDNKSDITSDNIADISNIYDMDNWLGDINPNYDELDYDSPYSNNCGSCAYAVWNRLNGIDNDMCATAENIGYNSDMEALTGMEQVSMSPEDIENTLLSQGEGANAIIGIDRSEGFGHWFNAACVDGKVIAIDGQTGEVSDWPPDYGDVVNWEMSIKKGA